MTIPNSNNDKYAPTPEEKAAMEDAKMRIKEILSELELKLDYEIVGLHLSTVQTIDPHGRKNASRDVLIYGTPIEMLTWKD